MNVWQRTLKTLKTVAQAQPWLWSILMILKRLTMTAVTMLAIRCWSSWQRLSTSISAAMTNFSRWGGEAFHWLVRGSKKMTLKLLLQNCWISLHPLTMTVAVMKDHRLDGSVYFIPGDGDEKQLSNGLIRLYQAKKSGKNRKVATSMAKYVRFNQTE